MNHISPEMKKIYIVMQSQYGDCYGCSKQIESIYFKAFLQKEDAEEYILGLPKPKVLKFTHESSEEAYYIETLELV